MFRRSRFSVRPNVGTAGKTPQEAPSANPEASETPKDVGESSTAAAVTDNQSVVTPSEKPTAPGDGNEQNAEGTSSSAAVQRRKRFSIKPKVAPGRPSAVARTQKSSVKAVSDTPIEVPVSDLDEPTTSSQTGTTVAPQRLQSPRRRRSSEDSKQPKVQPKPTPIPSDSSEPSADSATQLPAESGKELESMTDSEVKGVPSKLPDQVPLSLPEKEAIAISEKAKTLVSSKSGFSLSQPAFSLSRLLNDPSDLQRIAKAQKLRQLLKQEMHKEKKLKKANTRVKEYTLDPAKMTMRDLIRYLPESNPMTSSLEEPAQENETVIPPSPVREASPERVKEPEVLPKIGSPREVEDEEEERVGAGEGEGEGEGEEDEDEEQEDSMMVPQVKVAEDGSLIIDEESLTVEVLRAKGPNPAQDRDPIFERGSTTTYSSFRKGTYTKPWSSEETDMFFLAISMVGTDFSMICQLFPLRARSEIKNKFKKEERENSWRVDKAFRERRKLDIEYFSKLLEKILEVQKNRKKLKSLAGKNSPKKTTRKAKGKKAGRKLSVVEEEDEKEEKEIADLEEEGEKENEDLCNEGGADAAKPKKKRKRKNIDDALTEEPNDKKNKTGEKSNEQDEAYIPGDAEAALPEDCPTSDMAEKTEGVNDAVDAKIKPAKLSRGRASKPLLPLGRKWGKKPPPASTKTNDAASDREDEGVIDGGAKDQVNKDASPFSPADEKKSATDDSEEEDTTVQPPRPTRFGRVPKPIQLLNYPSKEAASEATPVSPEGSTASAARPKAKCTTKRGRLSKLQSSQESKKPKLFTLRASQSEYSDEEDEKQREEEDVEEEEHPVCSSSKDSTAPVFVPASLRSPQPVIPQVEETMEEFDILANIPDVLGISQDALCPDASCERAHNETGTAEPCEHQLDLLVDVIDFLSSDHTEVSENESYNEAAQTLLTISNLAPLPQSEENEIAIKDHITGTTSADVNETSQHLEEEMASKLAVLEENSAAPLMSATFDHGAIETSDTVPLVELLSSTTDNDDISVIESIDQRPDSDMDPTPQLQSLESSKTNSPRTKKGRSSKVKPKPNLGQASRTAQVKFKPGTSTLRRAEKSHTVTPDLAQTTETPSAAEETPKIADCGKDGISDIEVKCTEEPSGSQKRSVGEVQSHAATSDQSASENQSHYFSEAQLEPSMEQATGDSRATSGSTDEILMSHVGTIESICNNRVTSDEAVTESQTRPGSNVHSAPAQESSDHPAPCVTPVDELPVSQKEESEVGSSQPTRKSRFPKVKPKLNLAQTSRTVRSKPQTTKDSVEKHSNPTPNPESHESQFEPSREQATKDTRPTSESTDEALMSLVGTAERSCNNLLTSDTAVTESQTGPGSNVHSAPAQESSDHPAPCVTPADELPVSQKEEREVGSTQLTRKSRFPKVKPKLNLAQTSRTVRSKPQTTKDAVEKHSNPTPNPESPENTSSTSDLIPSLDFGTTLTPTEELSTTEEEKTDAGVVGQVESDAATSHQSVSENQNISEAQFTPRRERATRDTMPILESLDEELMSHFGAAESRCNDPQLTSDSAVTESLEQGSNMDSAPVQESSDHPASSVTHVEELPASQKEESGVASTRRSLRRPLQKVKPKPNLAQTSRAARSKPHTTKDPVTPTQRAETPSSQMSRSESTDDTMKMVEAQPTCKATPPEKPSQIKSTSTASVSEPSGELCSTLKTTEDMSSTEERKTDVGLDSNSKGSEQNVPQRRQRFSKVKPNLGSSPRTTCAKLQSNDISKPPEQGHMDTSLTSEQQPVDNDDAQPEQDLTGTDCQPCSSTKLGPAVSEKSQDDPKDEGTSPGSIVILSYWGADNQPVSTDLVLENLTVEGESIGAETSDNDQVEAGPASSRPSLLPTSTQSTADSKESTGQPLAEDDCEAQSRDAVQQCSGMNQTAAQSSDGSQTEPTDSPSRKSPKTRRGRLIKPRPQLVRSSRPPQPLQQVQNTKEAETDSGACSEGADASVCHKSVSELRPDIPAPAEGAIVQCSNRNSSPNAAGSSLSCLTQVPDTCTLDASTSNTGGTQNHPSLPIFPDISVLSQQQQPLEPDEPFFILSLTEIPVCSLSERVGDRVPEPLPHLPVPDASIEQQSVPGESSAAGEGPPSYVTGPASMEESGETGLVSVQDIGPDPAACTNPVAPHESSPVHPSKLPETQENNDETEIPPAKPGGAMSTRRRVKEQVKPKTTKRKQASKALVAKEHSALSGPSLQPEAFDDVVAEPQTGSGDHADVEKETLTRGGDPEESSSGAQTTRTRRTRSQNRKPKGTTPASDSPPGPKVRTPRAAGKRSTPAPVASTSHAVAPTRRATRPTEATHSTSSSHSRLRSVTTPHTPLRPAKVPASQKSDSVESSAVEEEPTSVSQYFLCDIFTEVEEG